jgi:IMP dehydrogenase
MGYTGCRDLDQFRQHTRFARITGSGVKESHVHDVTVTKEAPNYPSY